MSRITGGTTISTPTPTRTISTPTPTRSTPSSTPSQGPLGQLFNPTPEVAQQRREGAVTAIKSIIKPETPTLTPMVDSTGTKIQVITEPKTWIGKGLEFMGTGGMGYEALSGQGLTEAQKRYVALTPAAFAAQRAEKRTGMNIIDDSIIEARKRGMTDLDIIPTTINKPIINYIDYMHTQGELGRSDFAKGTEAFKSIPGPRGEGERTDVGKGLYGTGQYLKGSIGRLLLQPIGEKFWTTVGTEVIAPVVSVKTDQPEALRAKAAQSSIITGFGLWDSKENKALTSQWKDLTYGQTRQMLEKEDIQKEKDIRGKIKTSQDVATKIEGSLKGLSTAEPSSSTSTITNPDGTTTTTTYTPGVQRLQIGENEYKFNMDNPAEMKKYSELQQDFATLRNIESEVNKYNRDYTTIEQQSIQKAPLLYATTAIGKTVFEAGLTGGLLKDVGAMNIPGKLLAQTSRVGGPLTAEGVSKAGIVRRTIGSIGSSARAQQLLNVGLATGITGIGGIGGYKEYKGYQQQEIAKLKSQGYTDDQIKAMDIGPSPLVGALTRGGQAFGGFRAFEVGANPLGPRILRVPWDPRAKIQVGPAGTPASYVLSTENPYSLTPRATVLASYTKGVGLGPGTTGLPKTLGSAIDITQSPTAVAIAGKYYPELIGRYKSAVFAEAISPRKFTEPIKGEIAGQPQMPQPLSEKTSEMIKERFLSSGKLTGRTTSVGGSVALEKPIVTPSDVDITSVMPKREYNKLVQGYGKTIKQNYPELKDWTIKGDVKGAAKVYLVSPDGAKIETFNIPNANPSLEVPSTAKRYVTYQPRTMEGVTGTGISPTPSDITSDALNRILAKVTPQGTFTYGADVTGAKAIKVGARSYLSGTPETQRLIATAYPEAVIAAKSGVLPKVVSDIIAPTSSSSALIGLLNPVPISSSMSSMIGISTPTSKTISASSKISPSSMSKLSSMIPLSSSSSSVLSSLFSPSSSSSSTLFGSSSSSSSSNLPSSSSSSSTTSSKPSSSSSSSSTKPSSSSSSSSTTPTGGFFGGSPWPSLGALGMGAEGIAATGTTTRGFSENYLRNFFFEKFRQTPEVKKGQKIPVDTENLKFKLKITDMMGTTVTKSGKLGKGVKSVSIPTKNLERSKGVTERVSMNNATPFSKTFKRRV
jgi:hypothetical protein